MKLDPKALAQIDPDDTRTGVQPVTERMIRAYVVAENDLPDYSAEPFATWLDSTWFEYAEDPEATNRDVIDGALEDWCGGRTW